MSRNSVKSLVPKCRRVSISSGKKALVLVKTLQLQENKEKKEQPENVCHGCTSELNGLIFYAQRLSFPSVSSIPVCYLLQSSSAAQCNLLCSLYICIHIDFTCQFSILIFFFIVVAYLFAAFWELPVLCWANDLMHRIL